MTGVHYVTNESDDRWMPGSMLHAVLDATGAIESTTDRNQVTCLTCLSILVRKYEGPSLVDPVELDHFDLQDTHSWHPAEPGRGLRFMSQVLRWDYLIAFALVMTIVLVWERL